MSMFLLMPLQSLRMLMGPLKLAVLWKVNWSMERMIATEDCEGILYVPSLFLKIFAEGTVAMEIGIFILIFDGVR